MAGFHLTRVEHGVDLRLADAEKRFRTHGFTRFTPFDTGHYRGFHVGYIHGGPETFLRRGADFVAVAGTLVYKGMLGTGALEALLDDFTHPLERWADTTGQFALLVHKAGRTSLLTDYFGAFQLFHDPDWATVSTSFLGTAESLPRVRWHDQGVYEFAFNVFPVGDDTVLEEVRRLGPDTQVLLADRPELVRIQKPLPTATEDMPIAERLERVASRLASAASPFVQHFGNAMQVPLSGGLDSRLALAILRAQGVEPHVYVYGARGDEDVEVACDIARAEGFAIELFNKPAYRSIRPDEFAEIVQRNWEETDALTTDGGLFDNGGNAAARHARQAGGQLAVSGGCGEVFRNFFYLSDRRMRVRDVALAFWARFTMSDVTERFDRRRYLAGIEAKLAAALSTPVQRLLDRTEVEQLYPRVRCRAFFGREISLVARHGAYFMPFLSRKVVHEGLRLPMDLKSAGRFESMLINHIDPKLARHMSAYGHSFDQPPSRDHRLSEWSTRLRPIWIRQRSYAVQRKLGPMFDDHGGILAPQFLGRVLDLHFPVMQAFFNVPAVTDQGLYRRIATLELLGQRLGSRLAS